MDFSRIRVWLLTSFSLIDRRYAQVIWTDACEVRVSGEICAGIVYWHMGYAGSVNLEVLKQDRGGC